MPAKDKALLEEAKQAVDQGYLAEAEEILLEALALKSKGGVEGLLAALYFRAVEHGDNDTGNEDEDEDEEDEEGEDEEDGDDWSPLVSALDTDDPEEVFTVPDHPRKEMLRRAKRYNDIARRNAPDNLDLVEMGGLIALRSKRFDEALELFTRAYEGDPSRYFAIAGLGMLAAQREDGKGAERYFRELITKHSDRTYAWQELAFLYANMGRHEDSLALYAEAMTALPDEAEAFYELAWDTLVEIEDSSEEAGARFVQFIAPYAHGYEQRLCVAETLVEGGEEGFGVGMLRSILAEHPGEVAATALLGRALAKRLATREEGEALLKEVLEEYPPAALWLATSLVTHQPEYALEILSDAEFDEDEEDDVHAVRAAALWALGRAAQADKALAACVDASSGEAWEIFRDRAEQAKDAGHFAWAEELAQRAQKAAPPRHRTNALMALLDTYGQTRAWSKELSDLVRKACPKKLTYPLAYYPAQYAAPCDLELAVTAAKVVASEVAEEDDEREWRVRSAALSARAGDSKAFDDVTRTAKTAKDVSSLCMIADELYSARRFDEAHEVARLAFELDPNDTWAFTLAVAAHEFTGQTDKALALCADFGQRFPRRHHAPERAALILAQLSRGNEAAELAARAVLASPACDVSQAAAGLAAFARGNLEKARLHIEDARRIDPEWPQPDFRSVSLPLALAFAGDSARLEQFVRDNPLATGAYAPFYARAMELAKSSQRRKN